MTGLFAEEDQNSLYFSRSNVEEALGTFTPRSFFLDEKEWPSVEHYYQAMKFEREEDQEKIRLASTPQKARRMGRSRFRKRRPNWQPMKTTIMTRAVYIRAKTHTDAREALENTCDQRLVENNSYDYFWGCGRDRRGDNHYGKVLMNVREKLRQE